MRSHPDTQQRIQTITILFFGANLRKTKIWSLNWPHSKPTCPHVVETAAMHIFFKLVYNTIYSISIRYRKEMLKMLAIRNDDRNIKEPIDYEKVYYYSAIRPSSHDAHVFFSILLWVCDVSEWNDTKKKRLNELLVVVENNMLPISSSL